MNIPIYQFTEEEIKLARDQAEVQPGSSDRKTSNKKKGNLGEICFNNYCDEELPKTIDKCWMNEQAMTSPDSEYNNYDFELNEIKIDVKTRSDIARFHQD